MGKDHPFDVPTATLTGNITAANFNFSNGNSIFATINSTIATANTNMKGYVDGQISTTTTAITTANTNLKGYTDNLVTTANTNLKGYVDAANTIQSNQVAGANSAITTANTNLKGYVDGQISTTTTAITTANTNLKGYTDGQISTTTTAITTANTNLKGYTDNLVTTANTNMKGYVDGQITNLVNSAPATLDTLNELAAALGNDANLSVTLTTKITNVQGNVTAANAAIVTANTNLKGYTDGQISTTTTAITTANTNMKGYTDNLVTTANTNLKGYTDGQISTTTTAITTANTNMKGYVDAANTLQSSQISGANTAITTANTNLKGYVDGQISTTTTAITTANTNLKGYTDNLVTTANTNMKGYVDAANTIQSNQIGWANASISAANTAITTANTNMKGYVDNINSTLTANAGAQANSISSLTTTKANLSGATFSGAVTTTELFVTSAGGDEGGQLNLANATTNTTLSGNIVIDVYQNKLRIFEGGGTARGGYFDLSGLSAGVGTNLAAGGGGTPGGTNSQIQFNNSSSFGGATSLYYFSGNGVVLANAAVASTSTTTGALQVSGGIGVAGNVWCGQVYSTNNGNGTNYRIGDDAWLGGVNTADTAQLMGAQNGNNGYLRFGNVGTETLGRAGSGALTWTGTFSATNINSDNHNYANGTSIITTLSTVISTANTALKGYTDGQITTVSNSVTGANAAIVTANTALKGYTDAAITTVTNSVTGANAAIPVYTAGITAPSSPKSNDVWYDTATDITFLYINDGDSNQWVDITSTPLNVAVSTVTGTTLSISGAGSIGTTFSSGAHTITGSPTTALINGGTNGVGNIGASGATFNTIFAKSTSAQYADLAEKYTSDNEYNPGTVLIFGGLQEVTISTNSHDPTVAGVVTTNPAYLMNNDIIGVAVALTGRVPCQVKGPVNKGDRLVSSSTHGTAQRLSMSEYTPGCIIGKSLETIETNEIKLIEVAIGRF
jgi:hypothetical protein